MRWTKGGCKTLGWIALGCVLAIAVLMPAMPGRPGRAELCLAQMSQLLGGRAIIHFGLVRGVDLSGTKICDEDMTLLKAAIGRLESPEAVRWLDLSETPVGDPGIERLKGLKARSFQLYLDDTKITDRSLAIIGNDFAGLSVLRIAGTDVTEKGLRKLRKHPTLTDVYVSGPNLTSDLIRRLNDQRGRTAFHWSISRRGAAALPEDEKRTNDDTHAGGPRS